MSMKARRVSQAFALVCGVFGVSACNIAGTCIVGSQANDCPRGTYCEDGEGLQLGNRGVCVWPRGRCIVGNEAENSCGGGEKCVPQKPNATEGTCQLLLAPQPRLTRAQFASDCSAVELSGEAGIQPLAAYADSFGSIDSLCPQSVRGEETGFRCVLNATRFMPGKHSARWTVQDNFGGVSTSAAYAFQTNLSDIEPITFPMKRMAPSATLGNDVMVGRQVLAPQAAGSSHPLGGCWGSITLRGSIASGPYYSCALQTDGKVHCWGDNEEGQTKVPEDLGPVVAVAAGGWHVCALQSDGTVLCWGDNEEGQTTVLEDLGPVVAIATGSSHTCALQENGKVRCWGKNDFKQADVPGNLGPVVAIAAGSSHTCALEARGTPRCWGNNKEEEGRRTTSPGDLDPLVALVVGNAHSCALQENGKVRCWGQNNFDQTDVPKDLGPVVAIAAGNSHTCALQVNGTVRCWGGGNDTQTPPWVVPPEDLGSVVAISTGYEHTCALKADGTVRCWGIESGEKNYHDQTDVPMELHATVQTLGRLSIQ